MDQFNLPHNPYAVLTFIAAPALLTNASSVLAMSTINRMLRTRDHMRDLLAKSELGGQSEEREAQMLDEVSRVERQAFLLLRALRAIYVALGAFASATLVTLLGASLAPSQGAFPLQILEGLGLLLGFVGVSGIVAGTLRLFQATQLSLVNIRQEAEFIRVQQAKRQARRIKPDLRGSRNSEPERFS